MYAKVMLTLLAVVCAVIAVQLWRHDGRALNAAAARRSTGEVASPALARPQDQWREPVWPEEVDEVRARRIAEISIDAPNAVEAVNQFRRQSGLNVVGVEILNDAGDAALRPVRLRMTDVTVDVALRMLLNLCTAGVADASPQFDFAVRDGIIIIHSHADVVGAETRFYDVRSIVRAPPPGSTAFSDARAASPENLIGLVSNNVDPQSWRENGGSVGTVREFGGILVIQQSPANHRRIARFLGTLRHARAQPMPTNVPTTSESR